MFHFGVLIIYAQQNLEYVPSKQQKQRKTEKVAVCMKFLLLYCNREEQARKKQRTKKEEYEFLTLLLGVESVEKIEMNEQS